MAIKITIPKFTDEQFAAIKAKVMDASGTLTPMTFGSLFAGIGGFDLGFERAGMHCEWQVEIDPYCRQVLAKHWPNVRRWDDVRTFPPRSIRASYSWRGAPTGPFTPDVIEDTTRSEWNVDVICGGFPCQDISNAGKQAGIEGERSGLWREFARIISVLRPRFVAVENVAALLVRGMGVVCGDLAAIGYDAQWDVISAASVGAPHLRERVWIVAHDDRHDRSASRQSEAEARPANVAVAGSSREIPDTNGEHGRTGGARRPSGNRPRQTEQAQRQAMGNAIRSRLEVRQMQKAINEFAATVGASQWAVEPNVGRVADGVPARVDRLRGLGNAVVPQVAEWIGRRIMEVA